MKSGILILFIFFNSYLMNAQQNDLSGSSTVRTVTIRLKPGDDLKASLDKFSTTHQIKAACILTCVGSLRQSVIRYADKPTADTLIAKFEIVSLTGTLSVNGSHLHISISDTDGKTIGGHLKEGSIIYTTAEIVIGILDEVSFEREVDSTFGYKELVVKKLSGKN